MTLDSKRNNRGHEIEASVKMVTSKQELALLLVLFHILSFKSSLLQILPFWVSPQFL